MARIRFPMAKILLCAKFHTAPVYRWIGSVFAVFRLNLCKTAWRRDGEKTGKVKRFFYTDLFSVLYGAIEQGEEELQVTLDPQFKDFLAAFYTEASAGLLLEWVKNRMTQDRETVLQNLLAVYKISIPAILKEKSNTSFTENQKTS